MKNVFVILSLLAVLTTSCKHRSQYQSFLVDRINVSDINLSRYHSIVVIPGSGCPGCISEAENYCRQSLSRNDSILFIFTNIYSLKSLKNKLKIDLFNNSRIILDTCDFYYVSDYYDSMYPQKIILSKSEIVDVKTL
jgi:hypothetical protein